MKITILYSGGLDSLIMHHYAKVKYPEADIELLYLDIGHDYAYKEIAKLPEGVTVRKIDWIQDESVAVGKPGSNSGNIILPGRNALLAVNAACMTMPDEIWMGALCGETHDQSTDKNYKFLDKLNDLIGYVFSPFEKQPVIRFPLADEGWGKYEAVHWAVHNGYAVEDLAAQSSSCLSPEEGNCGHCVVCARRWGIFRQFGYEEKYNVHPYDCDAHQAMFGEMVRGHMFPSYNCHYDEYRRREIVPALLYFNPKLEDEDASS